MPNTAKQEAIRKAYGDLITDTLLMIEKQIGLDLKLCDYFTGLNQSPNGQYFNVVLSKRTSESDEYTKLVMFALRYKSIKVEPNGLYRVAIYPLNSSEKTNS